MPEIYNLEQSLSEQLDDLLVENKIESSRQSRLIFPEFGMGMIVSVKDPVRINLNWKFIQMKPKNRTSK